MILPPDWIENSIETYIYQHTTKSQAIYWVVLATIVLAFILLPFVYVDISIQSNGVIRPAIEKTEIKATISGIVNEVYVYEGQKVKKGDILLRFRASSSHEKITYQDNRLRDYEEHIADLKTLSLGGKPSVFRSPARLQEYQLFVSKKQELQVAALENGTVIDHIPSENLFTVVSLLGLEHMNNNITIGFNLKSGKLGTKGIIKIADKFFCDDEINRIAVVAPNVKLNIIRDYEVVEKREVSLPEELRGIVKCANPKCITNNEPMATLFHVVDKENCVIRCHYCEKEQNRNEIEII